MNRLYKYLNKCPRCNSILPLVESDSAVLNVIYMEANNTYVYCSVKCMEEALKNINSKRDMFEPEIEVAHAEVVSDKNPFKMKVLIKLKERPINIVYNERRIL